MVGTSLTRITSRSARRIANVAAHLRREAILLSGATRRLVYAMQRRQERRLVRTAGVGADDGDGHGGFVSDGLFASLHLRRVDGDHDREETAIRTSDLDRMIMRPANQPR